MNSFVLFQSSLIPLLLITSFLSINLPSSVRAADTEEYANCSQPIICGSATSNISYPFWGANRAEYCGKSGYQVTCMSGVPIISMRNINFTILDYSNGTSTTTPTVKVARQDYWRTICPSTYIDTNLTSSLYTYSAGLLNLSIWYGCDAAATSIFVQGNSHVCNSSITASYLTQTKAVGIPFDPVTQGSCKYKVMVPIFASASEDLDNNSTDIQTAIDGGFELNVVTADNLCPSCLESGGVCGSTTTSDFVCYCKTTSSKTTCTDISSRPPTASPSSSGIINFSPYR